MHFINQSLECYIKNKSLEMLVNDVRYEFVFPPESVQYYELVDETRFKDAFLHFVDQLPSLHSTGVIFLSPTVVFTRNFDFVGTDENTIIEQFLKSVPLKQYDIAMVTVKNDNKMSLYVTNRKLYELLLDLFKQKKIEICFVVPVSVYLDISGSQENDLANLKSFITNKKLLMQVNFLQSKLLFDANKSMQMHYLLLGFSLVLLVGAIFYLFFHNFFR